MSGAPYYKLCKETRKIECLTCGRKLSGTNVHNMRRHYQLVHRVDIKYFIKKRKKKNKRKQMPEDEEQPIVTINMQNDHLENNDEEEEEVAEMVDKEDQAFVIVNVPKEEDISENIDEDSMTTQTFSENKINEFIKHYDIKKTECLRCGKFLSGVSHSNIKRHFLLIHHENLVVVNKHYAVPKDNENNDSVESMRKRPKLSKSMFSKTFESTENMDKNKFLKYCIGLVAIKGVSLSIFDDNDFFKSLISPQEEKFGTNLNSKDILSLIEHSSLKIRDIITRNVNNKFVSLKLDIVNGIYHNVLGINIQYIDDFKIYCCTLDIMQVDHTDILNVIKNNVLKCLENYQIDKDQVYCCTVHTVNNIEKCNYTIQNLNEDEICAEMAEFEANISASNLIHSTVNDVLVDEKPTLSKYRKIVEKLWTASPGYRDCLPLDTESDWLSTYEMLKSLLEIRCCLEEEVAEHLESQLDWAFITDITSALAPLVNLINQLDNEQYVVGDFYRDWLNCEIELEEILSRSKFARLFVQTMQTYKKKLLKSNAFLTALYLDPRFNFCTSVMLTEEQKSKAEAFLKTAYKAMSSSRKSLSQTTVEEPSEASLHAIKCEEEPNTSKKAYDKLTQRIMNLSANIGESEEPQRSFMHKLIGLLSNKTMAPLDTDVLQYWKAMSFDAEVAEMLQAALSVPVTQVTVGRATSALVNSKEHAINYNLLLTKYNFHEINQPEVELEVPRELLQEMSFEK